MERGKFIETYKGREIELHRANLAGAFRITIDGKFIHDADAFDTKRHAVFQARSYVNRHPITLEAR